MYKLNPGRRAGRPDDPTSEGRQAMAEDGKKTELRRITADLEQFVAIYCATTDGKPSDFAEEKCNDAALMLREALDRLDQDG